MCRLAHSLPVGGIEFTAQGRRLGKLVRPLVQGRIGTFVPFWNSRQSTLLQVFYIIRGVNEIRWHICKKKMVHIPSYIVGWCPLLSTANRDGVTSPSPLQPRPRGATGTSVILTITVTVPNRSLSSQVLKHTEADCPRWFLILLFFFFFI